MSNKMFNKKLPKKCEYCKFAKPLPFGEDILCEKRGVTKKYDACRKYKYDILKRQPAQFSVAGEFDKKDFEI